MDINQLSPDLTPQLNDLILLWSTSQGLARKVPLLALQTLINTGVVLPKGILSASTVSIMRTRVASPLVKALTTAVTVFNPFQTAQQNPPVSSASAFAYDLVNGNFVAQRDVALAAITLAMQASWANATTLTLQAWVGPDATPYVLTPAYIGAGTNATATVHFSGIVGNPNNLNGVIKAGDKIKLAAALSTAGNLSITALDMSVQSLDGV